MEVLETRRLLTTFAGPEFAVNTTTGSDQFSADVARAAAGDFVAVWSSFGQDGDGLGIYQQLFDAQAEKQGGESLVNGTTTDDQLFPTVAMDSTGRYLVAWESNAQDGDGAGVFARRFLANGQPDGDEFQVNTTTDGDQLRPQVAMAADGQSVIVWSSFDVSGDSDVFGQRFAADGTRQGTEFRINDATANGQFFPSISMNDDGRFAVVWESAGHTGSGLDIVGRTFGPDGQPSGPEFPVTGEATGDQAFPSVSLQSDGRFFVAWDHDDLGSHSLVARRFDPDGSPLGAEFHVTHGTTQVIIVPQAAVDNDNELVVVWDAFDEDGSGKGVLSRRFDLEGLPLEDAQLVNATTANDQSFPTLAMDGADNYVVLWESFDQDGDAFGVFGQRFTLNDSPVVDLNGPDVPGNDIEVTFHPGSTPQLIVSPTATASDPDRELISLATATLLATPDGNDERLQADTSGTSILASYDATFRQLALQGPDTLEHFVQVLRSVSYTNTSADPSLEPRSVDIVFSDAFGRGPLARSLISPVLSAASISGNVYADVNNNGIKDPSEIGLPNVPIMLTGPVAATVSTTADGTYVFPNLPPGVYHLAEQHPVAFVDGKVSVGQPAPANTDANRFSDLVLEAGTSATGYNFGERGLRAEFVTKRMYLAISPPASQIVAEYTTVETQRVFFRSNSDVNVSITASGEAESFDVELYSESMLPVAIVHGGTELNTRLAEGESYLLYVAPTSTADNRPIHIELTRRLAEIDQAADRTDPLFPDVNRDGLVTPLDALSVINLLNFAPDQQLSSDPTRLRRSDISGDSRLDPMDALIVINYLNRPNSSTQSAGSGPGEGEMARRQSFHDSDRTERLYWGPLFMLMLHDQDEGEGLYERKEADDWLPVEQARHAAHDGSSLLFLGNPWDK